jgi:hypothetical protein
MFIIVWPLFMDITSAYGLPRPAFLILQDKEVENYGNATIKRDHIFSCENFQLQRLWDSGVTLRHTRTANRIYCISFIS